MKLHRFVNKAAISGAVLTLATLCALTMTALASHAHAAGLYWNSAYSGGTWTDTGGTGWNTSGTGLTYNQAWGYGGNYDANFTGAEGTVNVSGTISSVNSMTFSTPGYALNGGTINLTGAGGQVTTSNGTETINSNLAGSVGLTKSGGGTLVLGGTSSYTGITTLAAGTLKVSTIGNGGVAGNLGMASSDASNLVFNGGTLEYAGATASTDRAFTINSGGTATIQIDGAANLTISGSAPPTASALAKIGIGTLTLSGANAYTGTTAVSAGELDLNCTNGNAIAGGLIISGGTAKLLQASQIAATQNLIVNSGTCDIQGYNQSLAGVTLTGGNIAGSGGTLTSTTAYNMQAGSVGANLSGSVALNKTTNGAITVSGLNSYSGGTAVNGGSLEATMTGSLPGYGSPGSVSVASGATLLLRAGGSSDWSSDKIDAVLTNVTFASSSGFGIDVAGVDSFTYGTAITGNKSFTKIGTGVLTLGGANSYTGGTNISGGTLCLASASAIGTSGMITFGGGTLQLFDSTDLSPRFSTTGAGQAYNVDTNNQSVNWTAALTSSRATLTKLGVGTLTLSAVNTYSGLTTVSAGELDLNSASGNAIVGNLTIGTATVKTLQSNQISNNSSLVINGGTLDLKGCNQTVGWVQLTGGSITGTGGTLTSTGGFSLLAGTISAAIGGSGTVAKSGTGTVTLSGANADTGTTYVQQGELDLNATTGFAVAGNLTVVGVVRLLLPNQIANGASLAVNGGTFDLQGYNQSVASATLNGGNITGSGGTLTSATAYNLGMGSVSAILSGVVGLNKNSVSKVILSSANVYSGATTINGGTLQLSGGSNRLPITTSVTLANTAGASLDLNGQNQTIASLSGGGPSGGNVTLGGGTLTLDSSLNGSPDTIYNGVISGTGGSVVKQGANKLTLGRANTYTGSTTINAGTLALGANNALPTSSAVTLGGGTLATGGFSQTQPLGQLTLSSSSTIDMGLLGSSVLDFADSHLALWSGTLSITNWNGSFSGGGADELFFGSSALGLTPGQLSEIVFVNPNGLQGDYQATILATGEIAPVPEPTTIAQLAGGALLLGALALRRRRRNITRTVVS